MNKFELRIVLQYAIMHCIEEERYWSNLVTTRRAMNIELAKEHIKFFHDEQLRLTALYQKEFDE